MFVVSIPNILQQQKHLAGSIPKLVIFPLVGGLPYKVPHNKKKDLNGIQLRHARRLNNFCYLFSDLIPGKWEAKHSIAVDLPHSLIWMVFLRGIFYDKILDICLAGACWSSLFKFYWRSVQNSAILQLVNQLLLFEN